MIFAASLLLVLHAYFGYPLTLRLISLIRRKPLKKGIFQPSVSLIITACNEERRIRDKLENTIRLKYPAEKLQVLVASDGSTDATTAIL